MSKQFGLPRPEHLRRYQTGQPLMEGPALLGGDGTLLAPVRDTLKAARRRPTTSPRRTSPTARSCSTRQGSGAPRTCAGSTTSSIRRSAASAPSGRVLVLGRPPESFDDPRAHTAQRALEGFTRSAGKELRRGATTSSCMWRTALRATWSPPCASCCRPSPRTSTARWCGRPGRGPGAGRLGAAARRPSGAGHRRLARHRRGDRRDARPRRRACGLPGRAAAGRRAGRGGQPDRRRDAPARHHRRRSARRDSSRTCASATAASTWSCTTRA